MEREHLPAAWRELRAEPAPDPGEPRPRRRVTGVTLPAGLGGVTTALDPRDDLVGLRSNLVALCDVMDARGAGVLITVDEIHKVVGSQREDIETLAGVVQHLWREDRAIAFFGAGLPAAVQDLLTDRVITFLRRAERFDLLPLDPDDAREALERPVAAAGRAFAPEALDVAVSAAAGYPYLLQVLGDLAWKVAPDSAVITAEHVQSVVGRAVRSLGHKVHGPAVAGLSGRDRDVLMAMLGDDGSSAVADLRDRLGVDHAWMSRYRQRLIDAGMVRPDGRGRLAYALPYLRDHLESLVP